ncbi:MAG TPA: EAL domain-containing protein, partial [Burkholderiaceae bacterium]|nr:EAL domain-containing protein [Burkholderiaceae bacterium]
LEDCTRVQQTLNGLSRMGLHIVIDDFGTGYSALSYLSKFDVDCIKIDRQFVSGIGHCSRQAELVKAFLAIARALHLGVVAEGVETQAQAAFLRDQGCGLGQGHLFMKPASLAEFHRFLAAS